MKKLEGYDEALLGQAMIWGVDGERIAVLVYDAEGIRSILMERDGMDADTAREFIEYNIEDAYVGPDTPLLVWPDDEIWWDE
jgi:hypothetical protein